MKIWRNPFKFLFIQRMPPSNQFLFKGLMPFLTFLPLRKKSSLTRHFDLFHPIIFSVPPLRLDSKQETAKSAYRTFP